MNHRLRESIHCPPDENHRLRESIHCPPGENHRLRESIHCPPGENLRLRGSIHRLNESIHGLHESIHGLHGSIHGLRESIHELVRVRIRGPDLRNRNPRTENQLMPADRALHRHVLDLAQFANVGPHISVRPRREHAQAAGSPHDLGRCGRRRRMNRLRELLREAIQKNRNSASQSKRSSPVQSRSGLFSSMGCTIVHDSGKNSATSERRPSGRASSDSPRRSALECARLAAAFGNAADTAPLHAPKAVASHRTPKRCDAEQEVTSFRCAAACWTPRPLTA
jgi:hypothetical protein